MVTIIEAAWVYWRLDPATTGPHAFGVQSAHAACLGDAEDGGTLAVWVRWDGCTFVTDERPLPYHLCDLGDEVARWQELQALASSYFGGDFGIGLLTDEQVAAYVAAHQLELVDGNAR